MNEAKEKESARRVVAEIFGPKTAEALFTVGQGLVNRVYGVRLDGETLVVRFSDEGGAASEHRKEAWCLDRAAAAGIPGPAVRAVGTLGPVSYMVQTFLDGAKGEEAQDAWPHIWRELGRYARLTHAIPATGFGGHLADPVRGIFGNSHSPTWTELVDYNIASLTVDDPLLGLGVYAASQRPQVAAVFEGLRDRPFRFGLCHNDLKPRNTILRPTGEVCLLDWGSAVVHVVPHIDLAELLRWQDPAGEHVRCFLDGYGLTRSEFEALLPDVEALQLIRAFDLVRWALDRRPERLASCAARARQILSRRLSGAPWDVDQEKWASEQVAG